MLQTLILLKPDTVRRVCYDCPIMKCVIIALFFIVLAAGAAQSCAIGGDEPWDETDTSGDSDGEGDGDTDGDTDTDYDDLDAGVDGGADAG